MASVNKVILVGNLGADPESRYMPNGDAVVNIRLATTESWKDKASGEKKELTEWHRVVFYRKLAEIAGQYLKKGSQAYIEGRLRARLAVRVPGVEDRRLPTLAEIRRRADACAGRSRVCYRLGNRGLRSRRQSGEREGPAPFRSRLCAA